MEAHNFDIRKHLLEFDDVMNKQREVIYSQRRFILSGEDLKEAVQDMVVEVVEDMSNASPIERTFYDEWDIAAFTEALWGQFGIRFAFEACRKPRGPRRADSSTSCRRCSTRTSKRKRLSAPEVMTDLEKFIMIQAVDGQWKDHLLNMDHLKDGIGLRGYGQRDPLKEYQKEGYEMFLDMSYRIKEETVRNLFLVRIAGDRTWKSSPPKEQEMLHSHGESGGGDSAPKTVRRQTEKIGTKRSMSVRIRKKYKKCCGKAA